MKFNRVDAHSASIEAVQHGREAIGETTMLEKGARAQFRPSQGQFGFSPGRTFAFQRLAQRGIARKQVVIRQWRCLVENSVSAGAMFHIFDLAPSARAVLDSKPMQSSNSKLLSVTRARLCLGSLVLLLRR
jgi:hypothetical protein